jgi:hypothetical protein
LLPPTEGPPAALDVEPPFALLFGAPACALGVEVFSPLHAVSAAEPNRRTPQLARTVFNISFRILSERDRELGMAVAAYAVPQKASFHLEYDLFHDNLRRFIGKVAEWTEDSA